MYTEKLPILAIFGAFLGLWAHSLRVTMVKFGVRVRTWDTLPALNFVQIAQGICPLWENFYQKFKIFAIFSHLSSYFYTDNVKILLKRTDGLWNPSNALPRKWCILISSSFYCSIFMSVS